MCKHTETFKTAKPPLNEKELKFSGNSLKSLTLLPVTTLSALPATIPSILGGHGSPWRLLLQHIGYSYSPLTLLISLLFKSWFETCHQLLTGDDQYYQYFNRRTRNNTGSSILLYFDYVNDYTLNYFTNCINKYTASESSTKSSVISYRVPLTFILNTAIKVTPMHLGIMHTLKVV